MGELQFFGDLAELVDKTMFDSYLAPLLTIEWVVYAKRPFAGPASVAGFPQARVGGFASEQLALGRRLSGVECSVPTRTTPMRIVGFTLAAAFISIALLSTAWAQEVVSPISSKKVEQVSPVWSTTLTRE